MWARWRLVCASVRLCDDVTALWPVLGELQDFSRAVRSPVQRPGCVVLNALVAWRAEDNGMSGNNIPMSKHSPARAPEPTRPYKPTADSLPPDLLTWTPLPRKAQDKLIWNKTTKTRRRQRTFSVVSQCLQMELVKLVLLLSNTEGSFFLFLREQSVPSIMLLLWHHP